MEDFPERAWNDHSYYRYPGWQEAPWAGLTALFSRETAELISRKVTELTYGLDKRPIVVPHDKIYNVLNGVFWDRATRHTGDIFTRYIIPRNEGAENMYGKVIDRTIEIIVSHIRNDYQSRACNEALTKWTTVLSDSNPHGLRAHPPIKVRRRNTDRMMFNMNY